MSDSDLSNIEIGFTMDEAAMDRELWRQDYERILADLKAICAQHHMSAAILMTEFDDEGRPHIDEVGIKNLRRMLAPLGYHVTRPFARWELLDETTPSGKRLFRCLVCDRVSPTPDKRCPGAVNCASIERDIRDALAKESV